VKVLLVHPGASFSVADVYNGLREGLIANGAEVGVVNLGDRLDLYTSAHVKNLEGEWIKAFSREDGIKLAAKGIEVVCYEWWPDIVLIVTGSFIPPETWGILARRPHHVVQWCTESPYEDDRQIQPARYVDTVIVNDPVGLNGYFSVNPRSWYLPHSYNPKIHKPGRASKELACDFVFVGTGFPSRIEFFEKVDWTGIDARFAGNWSLVEDDSPLFPLLMSNREDCIDNADAVKLYRSAKVSANLYRKETTEGGSTEGWAMGPREVELAACGTFFLREARGEGDEVLSMLPTFTTPTEFEDLLRWWLAHPAERKSAAAQARAAIADRTFEATTAKLLRLIDGYTKILH